jgi:hypothetical protein
MRCQCVGANVSPIVRHVSPATMPIKPALLSYRPVGRNRQGADRREPFSRNRTGEVAGRGLAWLCARDAAA